MRHYGPIHRKPWQAGNNGTGKRMWFVYRRISGHPRGNPAEYHESSDGNLIRYGSYETARRKASELNEQEVTS